MMQRFPSSRRGLVTNPMATPSKYTVAPTDFKSPVSPFEEAQIRPDLGMITEGIIK